MNYTKDVIRGGPGVTQVRKLAELEQFRREQESVRPLSLWNPMLPPGTVNASDDEFNDQALAAAWTEFDPGTHLTVTEGKYGLRMAKLGIVAGSEVAGICKALPAGNFSISTYLSNLGSGVTNIFDGIGICLWEDPTNNAAKLFTFNYSFSNTYTVTFASYEWTNYTTAVAPAKYTDTEAYMLSSGYFMRLRRNAANYYIEYSVDGIGWYSPNALAAITISFTPTYMGLFKNVPSTATTGYSLFQFFRYLGSDVGIYGILEGDRM